MAKGSAMGLWKGKKGSSVFYQIKNTNSAQKQGIRERNYEPSNPQSARQASQRMRMFPAQAVYNVLKSTIERSWQGVKYGQMTRQAYLKAALRSEYFPAVSKGDGVIVPGPYQIAKGTLPEVPTFVLEDGSCVFNFITGGIGNVLSTIKDVSEELLPLNSWLQEGDQLTFVFCYTRDESVVSFNWATVSFYVNTADETSLADLFPERASLITHADGVEIDWPADQYVYAGACVISREGSTPLRSNSSLSVNAAALPEYYGAEARARARRSYMKPLTVQSTDWPVDPGDAGSGDGTIAYAVSQVTLDGEGQESAVAGGTVSGGGSYLPGETVNLVATPAAQYSFQGWYPDKANAIAGTNRISSNAAFSFTAGDVSVVAGTTIVGKFMPQL